MMPVLTIALDAMGGDIGPPIILSGAIKALQHYSNLHIIACGDATTINQITQELSSDIASRITVHHCQDEITMQDKPSFVFAPVHFSVIPSVKVVQSFARLRSYLKQANMLINC